MVTKDRRLLKRRNMISSPSTSTSSAYASTDDVRRCCNNDKRNFPAPENVGNTPLLRTYSYHKTRELRKTLLIHKCPVFRTRNIIIVGLLVAAVICAVIACVNLYKINLNKNSQFEGELIPPDPETNPLPSYSKLRVFKRGAVCADGAPCAAIGKSILDRNGSAVDATIASMICNGLVNMQSMGLGGGFVMTIYEKASGRAYTLNARDRAPLAANSTMYSGKPKEAAFLGPLAIAVPGELAGYWEAHKRFGELPWADLFQPNIKLCEEGYNLTKIQHGDLEQNKKNIYSDPTLKGLFVDPETGEFYKAGSIIKPKALCKTLRIIAEKNATELYNGTLGRHLVEDLQKRGSIITMQDLNQYRATWDEPLQANLSDGIKLYTIGLPASGALLTYILNILDDYHFTSDSISNYNETVLTYHRMLESFKYAYALRAEMGDKDFVDMAELTNNLTSREYAHRTRMKIDDYKTWNDPLHYGTSMTGNVDNHGTAHISVLASNGDAVSATSTINFYFGSGVASESTGILLNNAMNDFGIPLIKSHFDIPPSPNNYIQPGKRPLSSMVPSIFVDSNGDARLVVGASGGTKITTSIAQIVAKILWMNKTVKEAVDAPRIHHQLFPSEMSYEFGIPKQVIDGLKRIGHETTRYRDRGSTACIIFTKNGTVYANADFRKGGDVYGMD